MMEPFLSEHRLLSSVRTEHGDEVRLRHLEVEAEEQRKREWEAGRRARYEQIDPTPITTIRFLTVFVIIIYHYSLISCRECRAAEEEVKRQAELEAARDHQFKVQSWAGISYLLGHMAHYLINELDGDRKARPIRAQRKAAALVISGWYKSILIRRRQRELVQLIKRVKRAIRPGIPRIKEKCRDICSMRVIGFLQAIDGMQQCQATVAVTRFMQNIHRLQDWWRTMTLVRETQYTLLTNHLIAYEKALIRQNKGEKRDKSPPPRPMSVVAALNATAMATGKSLFTTAAAIAAGTTVAHHHIEIEDPALERLLSKHIELLPKETRHRLVTNALAEERRAFARRMEKYRVDVTTYAAQLHVEELRLRLMREAGLEATPLLRKPVKPVMLALLPRGRLKLLLGVGIQEVLKYKRDVEQVEIEAAAERSLKMMRGGERLTALVPAVSQNTARPQSPSRPPGLRFAASPDSPTGGD